MRKNKISVIVPVYNSAKYLEQCINSLLLQTYTNLEILTINDCSTDNSLEILQKLAAKDCRIKIFNQEKNKGQGAARNVGLKNASGDWISFVDSDDRVSLSLYQKFIEDVNPIKKDVDIYYFNGFCFWEKSHFKSGLFTFFDARAWHDYTKKNIHSFAENQLPMYGTVSSCNKIFKREYLSKHNFIFVEDKIFEDVLFSMQTFLNTDKIYVKNDYLYNYRQQEKSTVHTMGKNALDMFFIHDEVEENFKLAGLYERSKYALFQFRMGEYVRYLFNIQEEFQEEFLQKAKEVLLLKAEDLDEQIYSRLVGIEKFYDLIKQDLSFLKSKYMRVLKNL